MSDDPRSGDLDAMRGAPPPHTPTPWELWQCGSEWMIASVRHGKLIVLRATRDGMQGATLRVRDHETCTMHKITDADVTEHPDLLFMLRATNSHDALLATLGSYAECTDGCTCGDGWSHDPAIAAIAEATGESSS